MLHRLFASYIMYCPKCSQPLVSDAVQFSSRRQITGEIANTPERN